MITETYREWIRVQTKTSKIESEVNFGDQLFEVSLTGGIEYLDNVLDDIINSQELGQSDLPVKTEI